MFTRPAELSDPDVARVVQTGWSLAVDSIAYAAVGFGSHHWNVTSGDRRWFVTVDDLATNRDTADRAAAVGRLTAALATARFLHDLDHDLDLTFVVAPEPATNGDVMVPVDDRYIAAVYPFVDGETHGWGPYGNREARLAVLELLIALHTAPAKVRHQALVDDFAFPCRDRLVAALADESPRWHGGPFAEPTRRLLTKHAGFVVEQLKCHDHLVSEVGCRPDRLVVTHGEPHRANTITTSDGVKLVDWDTLLVAPPERDLWWLAREDDAILDGYEAACGMALDEQALELYQRAWDLTDMALYVAQFRDGHDDSEDTRTAWDGLVSCFERAES